MQVQLLYFPECSNLASARRALAEALSTLEEAPEVSEVDVSDPRTPPDLRSWGSPTILIDGVDVAGGSPSEPCCRLYPGSEVRGVPPLAAIVDALHRSGRR